MKHALRFVLTLAATVAVTGAVSGVAQAAEAVGKPIAPKHVEFSFEGPFGTFDRAALQRGFQVYKEVCSACHSLDRVAFHSLSDEGGPGFTEAQVKAIAASYRINAEPNDQGEIFDANGERLKRPGIPADHFPAPFANEKAARVANGGALPPDLSLITKALEGGPARVYSIITGFGEKPPAGFHVLDGKYYNPYFASWNISMPPPLVDGSVTYSDGTQATVDQEAHDVVTFLEWAAEPKMEERKRVGFGVMAFLLLLSGLLYLSYRKVWKDAH